MIFVCGSEFYSSPQKAPNSTELVENGTPKFQGGAMIPNIFRYG